ncbi:Spy/CpxP family protein refolding chaperone [Gracilimonas sp.]|uniref:Spy/CpxP family protein refolding chaperone n=1 Tax=Gracilimonas sp. TaxID=1974203 RepID=UPI0028710EAB|nr:Spy/CpxP family protein refolding chaperone [Gracilimonas sp.]
MKLLSKILATVILFTAFAIQANAQQRQKMERPKTERMEKMKTMRANQMDRHQNMMRMLDLTEEQREQIKEIHLKGQKEMLPLRNQIREHRAKLQTLTTGDNYDENSVSELVNEMSELHAKMMLKRISHRQEIRELLTDEQRIKFDTFHMRNKANKPHMMRGMNR